jgi:hypothetical protein
MLPCASNEDALAPATRDSYYRALLTLLEADLPFLVGGAYALGCYTGILRDTKDFDVFVHPRDVEKTLAALARAGYGTELTDRVWLAKAFHGADWVDVIFSSGNGIATVDEEWFKYAVEGDLLGIPIKLIPAEEMIWSKSFVMTRERYDGADIAHVLNALADRLDWARLLRRFDSHWQVLYSHLILFGFIYPSERARIPASVMRKLADRQTAELRTPPPSRRICGGTLLSNSQYETDIDQWGWEDARRFTSRNNVRPR